jgi:peptide/nickel transport system permease protein
MLSFIGRSMVQKIITLFFVSIVSFLIIHLAPGEPSQVDPTNPKFTPEMVEKFREAFHLDEPLYVQYLYFYGDLFSGKTISWKDSQPVLKKIWERFLNSLPLFIVGTILTWTISFPVGIRSALFRGGIYDRSSTFFAYLLISIPGFFFAYILIIFVVTQFQVPVIGMETFGIGDTAWSNRACLPFWVRPAALPCFPVMFAARCWKSKARIMSAQPKPRGWHPIRCIINTPCATPCCRL